MDEIRAFRKQKGWTQAQLAEKIGVKRSVISKYESGQIEPSISTLKNIAGALNIPVSRLLSDDSLVSLNANNNSFHAEYAINGEKYVIDSYEDSKLSKVEQEIVEKFLEMDMAARSALLGYANWLIEDQHNNLSEQDNSISIDSRMEWYKRGLLMGIATAQANYSIRPEDIDTDNITLTPEINAFIENTLEKKRKLWESEEKK